MLSFAYLKNIIPECVAGLSLNISGYTKLYFKFRCTYSMLFSCLNLLIQPSYAQTKPAIPETEQVNLLASADQKSSPADSEHDFEMKELLIKIKKVYQELIQLKGSTVL